MILRDACPPVVELRGACRERQPVEACHGQHVAFGKLAENAKWAEMIGLGVGALALLICAPAAAEVHYRQNDIGEIVELSSLFIDPDCLSAGSVRGKAEQGNL